MAVIWQYCLWWRLRGRMIHGASSAETHSDLPGWSVESSGVDIPSTLVLTARLFEGVVVVNASISRNGSPSRDCDGKRVSKRVRVLDLVAVMALDFSEVLKPHRLTR